jgi:hypothetical protein
MGVALLQDRLGIETLLLDGDAYGAVDSATTERLPREVPALAFPPRDVGQ